jgi:hypothetical protein
VAGFVGMVGMMNVLYRITLTLRVIVCLLLNG